MKKRLVCFTGVLSHPYSIVLGITTIGLMIETLFGVMVVLWVLDGDGCDSADVTLKSQLDCPTVRHS